MEKDAFDVCELTRPLLREHILTRNFGYFLLSLNMNDENYIKQSEQLQKQEPDREL